MYYKRYLKRGKKGLSPVVATVLLISIVIAIAVVVFIWLEGFTQEAITKNEENVELVCEDVSFEAEYAQGKISLSNRGNVPIYDFKIKITESGNFDEYNLREISDDGEGVGLSPGKVYSGGISDITGENTDSITLIPILLGNSDEGTETHTCEESVSKKITDI